MRYHPENHGGLLIDNLVQFEEDFNSRTKKLRSSPVGIGYVRPDQFLDHLTVIKMVHYKVKCGRGGETTFLAGLGVHPCHPVLRSTILAHYQKSTKQCQSILTAYHKVPECFVLAKS